MRMVVGTVAENHLGDAQLVLVFGTRSQLTDEGLASRFAERFPHAIVAGCSTAGQFAGDALTDDEVIVTSLAFDHSSVTAATVEVDEPASSFEAGRKLGAALAVDELRGVLVLSDGTSCNGSALVDGLTTELRDSVTVFGGLAADGDRFEQTVVLSDGVVRSNVVTAIGFVGDRLDFRSGSEGGWEIFGPERIITSATENVLHELDGAPALELYSRYLGDRAAELPGSALLFPLAIRAGDSPPEDAVVRTILGVDEDRGTMTFAGDMPVGWKAQLMRASFDGLIDGAEDAAAMIGATTGPQLCIGISCVGRRLVLGQRAEEELDAVVELLPDAAVTGFYSYGELAKGRSGRCELHNQTMTLTVICEH